MSQDSQTQAIELLQQLGLKEYEAKCLVALTRMPKGTAKEISEVTDVPRTRVYDAIRVLEAKGLVEVQHSSPRQYRAVAVEEVTSILVTEYESRVATLNESLETLDPVDGEPANTPDEGEVWSLSSDDAIAARTVQLVEDADDEVVLVVGDRDALTDDVYRALDDAANDGVAVYVGVVDPNLADTIREFAPGVDVFDSNLDWLSRAPGEEEVIITRVVLVNRDTILVGARSERDSPEEVEQAVFGSGFSNGIVVILRRLLRAGLLDGSGSDLPDLDPPGAAGRTGDDA